MKLKYLLCTVSTALCLQANAAVAEQPTHEQEEGQEVSQLAGKTLTILCGAAGPNVSRLGQEAVDSVAAIEFKLSERADGLRVIKKFRGEIVLDTNHQVADESVIGRFKNEESVENKNYHPRVYKGFSQFREINAVHASGSQESGMVGTFLLEKNLKKEEIRAVYMFQAGDSMGGVLHLTCRKAD